MSIFFKKFPDFNSRAHVERDTITGWLIGDTDISTHALTWSATIWYGLDNYTVADFNSRAHVERDFQVSNEWHY